MLENVAGNVERYLDLLSVRQKLIASNIANADTPGYHTQDIDFEAEFSRQISAPPDIIEPAGLSTKTDGNNVNLDRESRLLAENALRFAIASNLARMQLKAVRSALDDGRSS